MAKGFDELIEFLLREVALCGEQGATTGDFQRFVLRFYDDTASEAPTSSSATAVVGSSQPAPTVDRRFCEKAWKWLTAHPDIWVGQNKQSNHLALSEVEELELEDSTAPSLPPNHRSGSVGVSTAEDTNQATAPHDSVPNGAHEVSPRLEKEPNGRPLRIYTTQERGWHAITGHGVDWKKIPRSEFELLSIIARHGELGVSQAELSQISGQDKRSTPKRTDRLRDHGYIEKKPVLMKGFRTSLCTLKKFVKKAEDKGDSVANKTSPKSIFRNSTFHIEEFIDVIYESLKDTNIVTIDDIRRNLGAYGKHWETKVLLKGIERLDMVGVITRVKARVQITSEIKTWFRCIKLVRPPTEQDRQAFVSTAAKDVLAWRYNSSTDRDADGEADPEHVVDAANGIDDAIEAEDQEEEIQRLPPQWIPDQVFNNFFFNLIEETGLEGITSMDLRLRAVGPFWKRPLDILMARLTDAWEASQPLGLEHLAIIRDTMQIDKISHYTYRSYHNFARAVEVGEAAWEPVRKTSKHNSKKGKRSDQTLQSCLDEWGFAPIPSNRFAGRDNGATLSEAYNATHIERKELTSHDPVIKQLPGRRTTIEWPIRTQDVLLPTATSAVNRQFGSASPNEDGIDMPRPSHAPKIVKKAGRPRKYRRGEEPYRSGNLSKTKTSRWRMAEQQRRTKQIRRQAERIALEEAMAQLQSNASAPNAERGSTDTSSGTTARPAPFPTQASLVSAASHGVQDQEIPKRKRGRPRKSEQQNEKAVQPTSQLPNNRTSDPIPDIENRPTEAELGTQGFRQSTSTFTAINQISIEASHNSTRSDKDNRTSAPAREPQKRPLRIKAKQAAVTPSQGRIRELITQLSDLTRPGVHINPPGSNWRLIKQGRPPNVAVVVIKSARLKELSCFSESMTSRRDDGTTRRSKYCEASLEPTPVVESEEDESSPNFIPPSGDVVPLRDATSSAERQQDETGGTSIPQLPASSEGGTRDSLPLMASSGTHARQNTSMESEAPRPETSSPHPKKRGRPRKSLAANPSLASGRARTMESVPLPLIPDTTPAMGSPNVSDHTPHPKAADDIPPTADNMPNDIEYQITIEGRAENPLLAATEETLLDQQKARQTQELHNREPEPISGLSSKAPKPPATYISPYCAMGNPNDSIRHPKPTITALQLPALQAPHTSPSSSVEHQMQGFSERSTAQPVCNHTVDPAPRQVSSWVRVNFSPYSITPQHMNGTQPAHASTGEPADPSGDVQYVTHQPQTPTSSALDTDSLLPTIEVDQSPSSQHRNASKAKKRSGVKLGGGVVGYSRAQVILDIINKCGGVYPGDGEIFPPFADIWAKQHNGQRPDRHTVARAVKNIVDQGKLRKLAFSFQAETGSNVIKHILTMPDILPNSPQVKEMQKAIIKAHPAQHFPSEVWVQKGLKAASLWKPKSDKYAVDFGTLVEKQHIKPWMLTVERRIEAGRMKKAELQRQREEREQASTGGRLGRLPRLDIRTARTSDHVAEDGVASSPLDVPASPPLDIPGLNIFPLPKQLPAIPSTRPFPYYELGHGFRGLFPPAPTRPVSDSGFHQSNGPSLLKWRYRAPHLQLGPGAHQVIPPDATEARPVHSREGPSPTNIEGAVSVCEGRPAKRRRLDNISATHPSIYLPINRGSGQVLGSGVPRVIKPSQRPEGLKFINLGPHTYDPGYEWQQVTSLTHPNIEFHSPTGTFATHFLVKTNARLSLWVNTDRQRMFDAEMPKSLEDITSRVPRLKGKERDHSLRGNPALSRFEVILLKVQTWEIAEANNYEKQHTDLTLSVPRFMNYTLQEVHVRAEDENVSALRWHDREDQLYTIARPPRYEDLQAELQLQHERPSKRPRRGSTTASRGTVIPHSLRIDALRGSSSLPAEGAVHGLSSPNGLQQTKKLHRRQKRGGKGAGLNIPSATRERIIMAVVVVRALAGGLDQSVHWGLVEDLFRHDPGCDLTVIRQCWASMYRHDESAVSKLEEDFQDAFVAAYARGELPSVDFEQLEHYDWHAVVKWALANVSTTDKGFPVLPAQRSDLDEGFAVQELPTTYGPSKEDLFKENNTQLRRFQIMLQSPYSVPSQPSSDLFRRVTTRSNEHALIRARSWVRANIATPAERYNMHLAYAKLATLGEPLLEQAEKDLLDNKVFSKENKGRLIPGRNYHLADQILSGFKRQLEVQHLKQAAEYKNFLDVAFGSEDPAARRVPFVQNALDGHVIALTDLLAHRRVKLVPCLPAVDHEIGKPFPRLTKWGFTEGGYKTRRMDHEHLHFGLDAVPTDTYIFGNPVVDKDTGRLRAPPVPAWNDTAAPIPLWVDIHGVVIEQWWERTLTGVVHALALRPGIDAEGMVKGFKGYLGEWELQMVIEWLIELGAARKVFPGAKGVIAAEWWWLVLPGA